MRIDSNIAGIIRQTERLIVDIPVAMERALQPNRWLDRARTMANTILLTLAQPQERKFIPQFIATLTATFDGGGLALRMQTPFPALTTLLTAQAARGVTSNKDLGMGLFNLPLQEFEDMILKWVEAPVADGGKQWDSRDAGKSPEDVSQLISYIMLSPQIGIKGAIARAKLTPHIAKFLAAGQANRLPPATVDLWLRTVLDGWREMVRLQYLTQVRTELHTMKGDLL